MEKKLFNESSTFFLHPFTLLLAGGTSSGKSTITFRIIKHRYDIISERIDKVLYCVPRGHSIEIPQFIEKDKHVIFHDGIPDFEETQLNNCIVVLDDLMDSVDGNTMSLFSRVSHHRKISVLLLAQNLFLGTNKFFRTISLNCHYIIATKNPRDKKQISTLSSQLFPENVQFVKQAFFDATREPYSYLLFDISQKTPDELRFRTNIFPDDMPHNILYLPMK